MNWAVFLSITAIVVGPLVGLITALVANHRSKRVDHNDLTIREGSNNTQLVGVLIEGFTEQVRLVNQSNDTLRKQVAALETKNDALEGRLDERDNLKLILLTHIGKLENMIPNPPGPPPRPFK